MTFPALVSRSQHMVQLFARFPCFVTLLSGLKGVSISNTDCKCRCLKWNVELLLKETWKEVKEKRLCVSVCEVDRLHARLPVCDLYILLHSWRSENHVLHLTSRCFHMSDCRFASSAGSGTTVHDTYNDFAEEDSTPQLDYKGGYGKTHTRWYPRIKSFAVMPLEVFYVKKTDKTFM